MTIDETRPPTVFISYSHDSPEHADRVLALSDHLRADGIDCVLDQYEDSPPEGFPRWMDRQIRAADFVLMICTPTYYRRVMGEEEPGKGNGVAWESTLIYQYIYNEGTSNTRFIPVLLEGTHASAIPVPWQGVKKYRPTTNEGYEALYRRLTGQLLTPKPALGTLRTLPPRERKQNFVADTPGERPLEVIDNVPYPHNPYFTGRETILQNLHEALSRDSATALTQGYAISGLGGIGKTQTAVEYAYRYRDEYRFIFWVRAETEVALQAGFVEIAKLLDLPEHDANNPADTVQAVKHWLERRGEWLLIFDNADAPELLKAYYPRTPRGHLLLTSRAQLFDTLGIARPLALEKMDPEEALSFLYKRTGRAQSDPAEKNAAEHLAAELGYLPLALEQAAAYITAKDRRVPGVSSQTYNIHRMVQEVVKDQMGAELQAQWAERVVRAVEQSFPEVDYQTWPRCERYIPHVLLCAAHIDRWSMTFWEARNLLYQAGYYFYQRGQYWEVEPLWKSALAICEQDLGPEHPDTTRVRNNYADLLEKMMQ